MSAEKCYELNKPAFERFTRVLPPPVAGDSHDSQPAASSGEYMMSQSVLLHRIYPHLSSRGVDLETHVVGFESTLLVKMRKVPRSRRGKFERDYGTKER